MEMNKRTKLLTIPPIGLTDGLTILTINSR